MFVTKVFSTAKQCSERKNKNRWRSTLAGLWIGLGERVAAFCCVELFSEERSLCRSIQMTDRADVGLME